jgi:hypothetical protein
VSKPPETHLFFLDRNLGRNKFSNILRAKGLRIEVHDEHFSPDASDPEWLSEVGQRGWVVVTVDRRIRYRQLEWLAFKAGMVRAFAFSSGNLRAEEMAGIFLKALPKIKRFLEEEQAPFLATITKSGDVLMLKR